MTTEHRYYRLGRFDFGVVSSDEQLKDFLDRLLPVSHAEHRKKLKLVDMDEFFGAVPPGQNAVQSFDCISYLMNIAFENHGDCLWMDAAALQTHDGKLILLSGYSHSGKSTASLALTFSQQWPIAAEDIVLIDVHENKIIPIGSPFSVRPGTLERIVEATGITPGPVLPHDRIPAWDRALKHEVSANFDYVFFLDVINHNEERNLEIHSLTRSAMLHTLLPISNALRLEEGADKMMHCLRNASCYRLTNGKFKDRLTGIIKICSPEATKLESN